MTYAQAAALAKEWGMDLMEPDIFDELRQKLGFNKNSWDYLKTNDKTLDSGLAWYGLDRGLNKYDAHNHNPFGGFRGSLWVSEI